MAQQPRVRVSPGAPGVDPLAVDPDSNGAEAAVPPPERVVPGAPPTPDELAADAAEAARSEARQGEVIGPVVPADPDAAGVPEPEREWLDPLEFLLSEEGDQLPEDWFPIERPGKRPWRLRFRAIPTPRHNRIFKDHTVIRRDKQTGELLREMKERELKIALILEATVNLDWYDKTLWKRQGVSDIHSCVEKVLLPHEIDRAGIFINRLCGMTSMFMEEEAGNS